MKILVLGGVAAGTKAAAKIKREDRGAEVKILTKGRDISYAGCGLPYYVGSVIKDYDELIVNTPESFSSLTGVEVLTGAEVKGVNFSSKIVRYVKDGQEHSEGYDALVIATGAESIVPPLKGVDLQGVFTVRTPDDAEKIRMYVRDGHVRNIVIAGAGFIGLEMAENLKRDECEVTVIDMADTIMPNAFDVELSTLAQRRLEEEGMKILLGTRLEEIIGEDRVSAIRTSRGVLAADMLILALGVRPATGFLSGSGIEMEKGAILVDSAMRTNIPDVYAAGDASLVSNRITGNRMYSAMGSTANISARVLAKSLMGRNCSYPGTVGTGIARILKDLNVARTGLTEQAARKEGFDVITAVAVTDDKAHYYTGSSAFIMKLIAEKKTHRILGFQILGSGNVDKMNDIAVVAVTKGMRVEEFIDADFSYAPPFSTAISPFSQICCVLENKILGEFETISPLEYLQNGADGYRVIDVLPRPSIPGATWVDLGKVSGPVDGIGKDEKLLLVCARGKRGYFLQNRLKYYGYTNTRVLEGGLTVNDVKVKV